MPVTRRDWPFLARDEELRLLQSAVLDQDGKGAVIVAPAGVGKTRLLRELLTSAADRGLPGHLAIATRATQETPYGALAHLLPGPSDGHDDVSSWYRAVAASLRPDGAATPLLAVDDAHLLDANSAALLLHLALTGTARVLVTVRRGAPVADPVTTLWKDELAVRVDLQPLSVAEAGTIIEAGLGGEMAAETRAHLASVSGGNVLFARELVYGAAEAGALSRPDGVWRWDGSLVLAPRLVDAVGQRIGELDPAARSALAVIALAEPLPVGQVARVVTDGAADRLEALGLVDVVRPDADGDGAAYRLAHPLYGDVVLAGTGAAEQRRLKLRLADALEAAGVRHPQDVVRIATWRMELGGAVDPELLIRAANLANRSFDADLAERLARAALARGGAPRAAVALARACSARNRFAEAEEALAAAEAEILASDDAELHQLYLDRRHHALYRGLRRRDETLAMLDRFDASHESATPSHRHHAGQVSAGYRCQVLMDQGSLTAALDLTGPILEPGSGADPVVLLHALEMTGEALAQQGRTRTARGMYQRLRTLAATGGQEVARAGITAVLQEALGLSLEGRPGPALAVVDGVRAVAADEPDPHVRGLIDLTVGGLYLQQGVAATARRVLLDAAASFRLRDSGHAGSWALAMIAEAEALLGNFVMARRALDAAGANPHGRHNPRMLADVVMAEALLRAGGGDRTGAARIALAGADRLGELAMYRARLLHLAARVGAPLRAVVEQLQPVADAAECAGPRTALAHVQAMLAHDVPALEALVDDFVEAGQLLVAAEAAAQASVGYDASGDAAAARHAAARSNALADRCEGARTPLLSTVEAPAELSRREAEVAGLVAGGLSNAEVADRLRVSVRTVESHLYQSFAKLGVRHRDELAEALRSHSPDPG